VPQLQRSPVAVAKRILNLLGCKPGKAKRVRNRGVAKGQVVRTTPHPGTYKQDKVVALTVSSGPAMAKRRGR
jgi:beta-lactam-binding protein with PASTA domain